MGDLQYVRLPRGEICTQGAQVLRWRDAAGRDVLFVSSKSRLKPGKPIRGGIPVIFPWFGEDPQGKGKAHGVVRREEWRIDAARTDEQAGRVAMTLVANDDTREDWPHEFRCGFVATFGAELAIEWEVENTGKSPFPFEQSLHTYFQVGDVQQIAVRGLDGVGYVDNKDGGARRTQQGDLRLQGETERFYHGSEATCTIDDPMLGRRIEMARQGAKSTLVWHPWSEKAKDMGDFDPAEWDKMVCIEAANVRESAIVLAPGAKHTLRMQIRVHAR